MKTEGKTRTRGILIVLAVICLAVWLACGAAVFFADSPAFAMGMAGFARQALQGAGWTLLAAAAAAYCALTLRRRSDSPRTVLVCAAVILAGCALAFFSLRDLVLDLPYLSRPAAASLHQLRFAEDVLHDGAASYTLEGVSEEGGRLSFSVTHDAYLAGLEQLRGGGELWAQITYLPHTDILFSLEYETGSTAG